MDDRAALRGRSAAAVWEEVAMEYGVRRCRWVQVHKEEAGEAETSDNDAALAESHLASTGPQATQPSALGNHRDRLRTPPVHPIRWKL